LQGLVYRPSDPRFEGQSLEKAIDNACAGASCLFVNRNRGSGTRILIDGLLRGRRPAGYAVEVRSHNAVAAAVAQGRADCGLAIEPVARLYHLGFTPSRHEQYDFAIPADRWNRPAVAAFRALVNEAEARGRLAGLGFLTDQGERSR
jgi:putative molybdopterin biosynthesis protein